MPASICYAGAVDEVDPAAVVTAPGWETDDGDRLSRPSLRDHRPG
jgi:hypothetical protein